MLKWIVGLLTGLCLGTIGGAYLQEKVRPPDPQDFTIVEPVQKIVIDRYGRRYALVRVMPVHQQIPDVPIDPTVTKPPKLKPGEVIAQVD